jgi:hypothetical protein
VCVAQDPHVAVSAARSSALRQVAGRVVSMRFDNVVVNLTARRSEIQCKLAAVLASKD